MPVPKDEILLAIRQEAARNGGAPLGKRRFEMATGIRESEWSGRYWPRWSDALVEAGFTPNNWNRPANSHDQLVVRLAELAIELGHYPVSAERNFHRNSDPTFPRSETFEARLGNRQIQLALLRDLSLSNDDFSTVYDMVSPLLETAVERLTPQQTAMGVTGSVYLMKSGTHYKIGRSNHVGRRSYEVSIQLPERLEVLHEIETDDPEGIEQYWHRRFASKRANGEWFSLTDTDVQAFRRRKSFM